MCGIAAGRQLQNLGQARWLQTAFETDGNDVVYIGPSESKAMFMCKLQVGLVMETFVRDPGLLWADTEVLGWDGFLYGDVTQLYDEAFWNDGMEYRLLHPGFIFRV